MIRYIYYLYHVRCVCCACRVSDVYLETIVTVKSSQLEQSLDVEMWRNSMLLQFSDPKTTIHLSYCVSFKS